MLSLTTQRARLRLGAGRPDVTGGMPPWFHRGAVAVPCRRHQQSTTDGDHRAAPRAITPPLPATRRCRQHHGCVGAYGSPSSCVCLAEVRREPCVALALGARQFPITIIERMREGQSPFLTILNITVIKYVSARPLPIISLLTGNRRRCSASTVTAQTKRAAPREGRRRVGHRPA